MAATNAGGATGGADGSAGAITTAVTPPVAGGRRHRADSPKTVEELRAALKVSKAALAASRAESAVNGARAAAAMRAREAAEARAASAEAREAGEAMRVLATTLIYHSIGASSPARAHDAPRTRRSEVVDPDAALPDGGLVALAVELARVPPNERNVLDTAAGAPSIQRLMNVFLPVVLRAVLPDAVWVPGAELATALRHDNGEVSSFFARADGALLPHPERHANVVTAQLTAVYTRSFDDDGPLAEGLDAGRRHAAIRLAHLLRVKYYELHPRPAALPDGRLAAYSLVADGYQLYVVCVEVAHDERRLPRLVCSQHGPMPLWGKALVDYAARRHKGAAVPALRDCYDDYAPGIVALAKILGAGRTVLGDVAFTVPADLAFTIPLPPPREWIHLGSGGASETYSTVAAGGRAVVVKVARQPSVSWQQLAVEKAAYAALSAHGSPCAAIPALLGTAMTPDGKSVAALALSAGGGGDGGVETVPVEEALAAADDVVVTALTVAWSAVVALHHASGARVVHRDVRGANTVWKVGAVLPTGSEVAAAIAAAEAAGDAAGAGGSSGVVTAAVGLLPPPPAQLVDWGVATVHPIPTATATAAAATAAEVFSRGEAVDICWLHVRLLPSLLDTDGCSVAELAARLRGPPAVVERHLGALEAASSAVEAALPVLRLLHLALTYGAAAATAATIAASWP